MTLLVAREVVVFLFVEAVLLVLLTVAALNSVVILRRWNFEDTSAAQYRLERRTYLVTLVIVFTLAAKILLLPFFAYMLDRLAVLVPGAMCAAGVIGANPFGNPLLVLKVALLFPAGLWLIVNRADLAVVDHRFLRTKLKLFLGVFALVVVESVLDWAYLSGIPTEAPVQCCSVIYGISGGVTLPLGFDTRSLVMLFYLVYALVVVTGAMRYDLLGLLAAVLMLVVGYQAVVHVFGTYVYQLPTHKCPFCMLQPEYHAVGYVLWGSLFLGTFFGAAGWPLRLMLGRAPAFLRRWSLGCTTLFVLICTLYVVVYYLRNKVLL